MCYLDKACVFNVENTNSRPEKRPERAFWPTSTKGGGFQPVDQFSKNRATISPQFTTALLLGLPQLRAMPNRIDHDALAANLVEDTIRRAADNQFPYSGLRARAAE